MRSQKIKNNNKSKDQFLADPENRTRILLEEVKGTLQIVAEGVLMNSEKIDRLKDDVGHLQEDMTEVKGRLTFVESDVSKLTTDVAQLKTDVVQLKNDVSELTADVSLIKNTFATKTDLSSMETRLTKKIEASKKEFFKELKPMRHDIENLKNAAFA